MVSGDVPRYTKEVWRKESTILFSRFQLWLDNSETSPIASPRARHRRGRLRSFHPDTWHWTVVVLCVRDWPPIGLEAVSKPSDWLMHTTVVSAWRLDSGQEPSGPGQSWLGQRRLRMQRIIRENIQLNIHWRESYDITVAMSRSSRADSGLRVAFKCLNV